MLISADILFSGYYTGAVYNDLGLKRKGFPGENICDGSVIVIKTHLTGDKHRAQFSKAVIVMRSPYDCLKAEYNRRAKGHTGFAKNTALSSQGQVSEQEQSQEGEQIIIVSASACLLGFGN